MNVRLTMIAAAAGIAVVACSASAPPPAATERPADIATPPGSSMTGAETLGAAEFANARKAPPSEQDITYGEPAGQVLKMDIYRAAATSAPAPVVLYVHGGGWTAGDKSGGTGFETIPQLVARGFAVAAINYRLAPAAKFPAQIEDVKCAVRFLSANASRYGIDPARVGAMGGSAGGHLVALLGTTDSAAGLEGSGCYPGESSRVQAVVDMFGPADLTVEFNGANDTLIRTVFGASKRTDQVLAAASPVTWVSPDDPPFLILHGERDTLVPVSQSEDLSRRLTAAGVAVQTMVVKNAGHGFVPTGGPISPSRQQISKSIVDFFESKLK